MSNTDLPEQYVSCDTYECEHLTEHPGIYQGPSVNTSSMDGIAEAAAIASHSMNHESMNHDEECIGCETVADCPDEHDDNDDNDDNCSIYDEGCELVRTTGYYDTSLTLELMESVDNDSNSDWSDNTWNAETPPSPLPYTPIKPPSPHACNKEEKKRKFEKNTEITLVKKTDEGAIIYYITRFANGETCYVPGYISKNLLKYGDKINVRAFITDGHINKWRAVGM